MQYESLWTNAAIGMMEMNHEGNQGDWWSKVGEREKVRYAERFVAFDKNDQYAKSFMDQMCANGSI